MRSLPNSTARQRVRGFGVRLAAVSLVSLAVGFVALPLVAIVARTSPASLLETIASPVFTSALRVSLWGTLAAHVTVLVVGTPVAWILARQRFPGRAICIFLLELPIMLPPAVAGIGLLAAFGRQGLLGSTLETLGMEIPFTLLAVVLASIFVSGPFYVRQAIAAFTMIDDGYLDVGRTLGSSPIGRFLRIGVPMSLPALEAGSAIALARGFGEFGATIMFAGSIQGRTETLPLAVYAQMDLDFDVALALATVLILVGAGLLLANRVVISWRDSSST